MRRKHLTFHKNLVNEYMGMNLLHSTARMQGKEMGDEIPILLITLWFNWLIIRQMPGLPACRRSTAAWIGRR